MSAKIETTMSEQKKIKLTKKDKHMQVICPVCVEWLDGPVCQTLMGHKFHKICHEQMLK